MKKAISYTRISTKDQSNFSLGGQAKTIIDYCEKQNITITASFTDDGESAKNFDRPNWKSLENFIQKNHTSVDLLIVAKYDRFSRNISEALNMIDKLEKKYGITIVSVMEPIALHPKSPYFFQFRTQMLLGANVEWLVIKDRTKFGIHAANKNGRWVSNAPLGYKNTRDEKNKPVLIIDTEKEHFIKMAFDLCLSGAPVEEIRRQLKLKGCKLTGNSSITRLLNNPLYCGMIKVNAYYDEPEHFVKGIHEPIISEITWWRVQSIINGNKSKAHLQINEAVPLRGILLTKYGDLFTAGNSRGKLGTYYWYYVDSKSREHFSAKKLHNQFDEILQHLNLPAHYLELLQQKTVEKIKSGLADREKQLISLKSQLKNITAKMDSLEEKYLMNDIDKVTYDKWHQRYKLDTLSLQERIEEISSPISDIWNKYHRSFMRLANMNTLFKNATIPQKHSFVKLVFDSGLYYSDGCYRTPSIMPIFSTKALLLQEKKLLIIEQLDKKLGKFEVSSPSGNSIELLRPLLQLVSLIKAA